MESRVYKEFHSCEFSKKSMMDGYTNECMVSIISLYSLIGDFGKSQNKCKWFNIWSNLLL